MSRKLLKRIRAGFGSLLLHKLRSGLAVLGILIGVTAVIWLVALGEGVSREAQRQIKDLGATNIIIRNVKPPQDSSQDTSWYIEYGLLRDDYDRIISNIPTIQHAVPMREIRKEVRNGDRLVEAKLVGCTTAYKSLNQLQVSRGRFLTDRDFDRADNVAVLGCDAARALFPIENPIGRTVQIGTDFYVVVGEMEPRTASAAIGGSLEAREYNLDVYIPLSTLRWRIGDMISTSRSGIGEGEIVELSQITITVGSLEEVDETAGIVTTLLEKYHEKPDFAVVVPKELLRQAEMLQILFNVLLVVIAGISLLVGGIGIMNIMLATVTERTREIGVRRALGARQIDIILQFLMETVVLSAIGGLLGVLVGFMCKPVVIGIQSALEIFFPDVWLSLPPNIRNLQPHIALWSIIAAFVISVAVGIVFGLYPARRAALMDPIEALRHE